MAKKKKSVNKSEEIRNYIQAHKDAKNKDVIDALGKKGVTVSPAQVSNIRSDLGLAKKRKKVRRVKKKTTGSAKATTRVSGGHSVSVDGLLKARDFADKVGGVDEARELLATLQKLNN